MVEKQCKTKGLVGVIYKLVKERERERERERMNVGGEKETIYMTTMHCDDRQVVIY